MFDELVESNVQNDLKKRRKFFAVSTVVVGILFSAAVVVSIYAADYGLGDHQFELVEMIAPVEPAPAAPEPELRRAPAASLPTSTTNVAMRQVNMARVDEPPTAVPDTVSTVRNTQAERPANGAPFNIGPVDTNTGSSSTTGRDPGPGGNGGGDGSIGGLTRNSPKSADPVDTEETAPPPLAKKPAAPKPPVSKGVLNGQARELPKPVYPNAAKIVGAQGQVSVQVTIDETGRVISANAVSGHLLLRPEAERAARNARFSPTLLSDVPVKVTGIITYNFVK